jgi:hypothetical protein
MRLLVVCPQCVRDAVERSAAHQEIQALWEAPVAVTITTAPGGSGSCARGHPFRIHVNDPGYAVLYERALQRLAAGEWRDAVLDGYTALDMYLATVPLRARYDCDRALMPSDLAEVRLELSQATKTSERALGAALAVASVVSGRSPPKFPSKLQELRNEAIHQGKYPSPVEAEHAVFQVEELVVAIEERLDVGAVGRDPPFRLAQQISNLVAVPQNREPRPAMVLNTVLGRMTVPQPTARSRLAEYKAEGPGWLLLG